MHRHTHTHTCVNTLTHSYTYTHTHTGSGEVIWSTLNSESFINLHQHIPRIQARLTMSLLHHLPTPNVIQLAKPNQLLILWRVLGCLNRSLNQCFMLVPLRWTNLWSKCVQRVWLIINKKRTVQCGRDAACNKTQSPQGRSQDFQEGFLYGCARSARAKICSHTPLFDHAP